MKAIDVIDLLPGQLAARLEADDFFSDIPVIVADNGNVKSELERKQAAITAKGGKRGVAVVVLPIAADDDLNEVAFGPLLLRASFQVVEAVEINQGSGGTGKSARRVARKLRDIIKPLRMAGLTSEFVPDAPFLEPLNLAADLGASAVGYQVNFKCYEADDEEILQVAIPVFSPAEAASPQFVLSSATPDAEIWYTTDDSYPAPGRAGSVQYTAPVDIADTVTVRACAYKSGCIASQVARKTLTVEYA